MLVALAAPRLWLQFGLWLGGVAAAGTINPLKANNKDRIT